MSVSINYSIAILGFLIISSAFGADLHIEPGNNMNVKSSFITENSIDMVKKTILNKLTKSNLNLDLSHRYRMAIEFGNPLFPSDQELGYFEPKFSTKNGLGLDNWLQMPVSDRMHDLLIIPDVDYYWPSDFYFGSKQVDFSADFIIHLQLIGSNMTEVHIIQINSKVRQGKQFILLGRDGPGLYWNIHAVPPSPQATSEMIDFLIKLLSN